MSEEKEKEARKSARQRKKPFWTLRGQTPRTEEEQAEQAARDKEREKKKARRRHNGVIRRRWLINSVLTTFIIVAVAVTALSLSVYNYYSATMLATLESQASTAAGVFRNYTETTYLYSARQFINQFEDKDVIEVQFLSATGWVRMSSLMDVSGDYPGTQDVRDAITNQKLSS